MKSILIIFLILVFAYQSYAHCPNEFEKDDESYCISYTWQKAQVKRKGELVYINELSPVINKEALESFRYKTSTAFFKVWAKGDKNHLPVYFENLRIFPYMQMLDKIHHDASSLTEYVEDYLPEESTEGKTTFNGYLVSQMALLDMEVGGCWSFRLTFEKENKIATSIKLENIEGYSNVSDERNFYLLSVCETCSEEPIDDDSGIHDGHH